MAQAYDPVYTVVVQGKAFQLTKSQIEFDGPNYFTTCFLGEFQEAQTRRLDISRDPATFEYIVKYLSGYEVFRPVYLGEVASVINPNLSNLRADALFFQLDGLVHLVDKILVPYVETMKPNEKFLAFLGTYRPVHPGLEDPADAINKVYRWSNIALTPRRRARAPFNDLDAPYSGTEFDDLHVLAVVQEVLKEKIGKDYHKYWRLVGYKSEYDETNRCLNIILVERL